jgi:glycerol-3-phosphate O-acyltransferase
MSTLGIVQLDNGKIFAPAPTTDEYASLTELGEIAEPTLERFHIVTALLQADDQLSMKDLEKAAAGIAHQLSAIYSINSPEFFDQSLFARFITTLSSRGCIKTEGNRLNRGDQFDPLKRRIEKYLDNDVRYNVMQAIASSEKRQSDSISLPG